MNNEIKINVPEGMEIDKENSTFECIKLKPKQTIKKGDIATAGSQIILVSSYIKDCNIIGFDVMGLAVLDIHSKHLTIFDNEQSLWVEREATTSEKALFIERLNKQGYVYNPNDPRIIYKKGLPKTWEEFCESNPIKCNERYINSFSCVREVKDPNEIKDRHSHDDANVLPSEEYAKAMLALCKLIQLRDYYNNGWEPDWNSFDTKYAIRYYCNRIVMVNLQGTHSLLTFKIECLRNAFYENFKDLIEQAKLLL